MGSRTLSESWTEDRLSWSMMPRTVGTAIRSRREIDTPLVRSCFTSFMASSECPPRAKKSSSMPACSTRRNSANVSHRVFSSWTAQLA
jgi:hypothetical protein